MLLRLFVCNLILLVVDDDDENGKILDPLRIDGKHLLHSKIGLLLYLLVLALDVGVLVDFDDIGQPQRLFQEPLLMVLIIKGHIVEKQFAGLLEPAEVQTAEVVLTELLIHQCFTRDLS